MRDRLEHKLTEAAARKVNKFFDSFDKDNGINPYLEDYLREFFTKTLNEEIVKYVDDIDYTVFMESQYDEEFTEEDAQVKFTYTDEEIDKIVDKFFYDNVEYLHAIGQYGMKK